MREPMVNTLVRIKIDADFLPDVLECLRNNRSIGLVVEKETGSPYYDVIFEGVIYLMSRYELECFTI